MKSLQIISTTVFIIIMFVSQVTGQLPPNLAGLYLTSGDYHQHKLSYIITEKNDKLLPHEFFQNKQLAVISKGKKHVFFKKAVYGFHLNNRDYRFFNNIAYRIEDSLGFCIYSHEDMIQQGKRYSLVRAGYFSTNPGSEIFLLNIENVRRAFPENYKFSYLAEQQCKSGGNLSSYDYRNKEYKIKELYAESLTKN